MLKFSQTKARVMKQRFGRFLHFIYYIPHIYYEWQASQEQCKKETTAALKETLYANAF